MHETLYDYAVIEEFSEGYVYPWLESQEFYKAKDVVTETGFYNMDGLTYEKMETPEEYPRYHAITCIG